MISIIITIMMRRWLTGSDVRDVICRHVFWTEATVRGIGFDCLNGTLI
jgi:hypothetical protein